MIEKIKAFILSVDPSAEHYFSTRKGDAYTTWQETGEPDDYAGDVSIGGILFQIDRFTKFENDPIAKAFDDALKNCSFIACAHIVYFERDTNYIHHVFDCEAV